MKSRLPDLLSMDFIRVLIVLLDNLYYNKNIAPKTAPSYCSVLHWAAAW